MNRGEIQQIGTPDEIYSNPTNTFVAGFIGSPPMNLIPGSLQQGRFSAPGLQVDGIALADGRRVTLGVRPEDATIATTPDTHLTGTLYGLEPTGDQTFVTVRTDEATIEVRGERGFRQALDTPIGIHLDTSRLYFFDTDSGRRLTA